MALLVDIVVEGEDRACEVQRRVEDVGEVVAEAEVGGRWRSIDSFALGVVGGIEVLLLKCVSFVDVLVAGTVNLPRRGSWLYGRGSNSNRS